jgi:hypothetical protein
VRALKSIEKSERLVEDAMRGSLLKRRMGRIECAIGCNGSQEERAMDGRVDGRGIATPFNQHLMVVKAEEL